MSMDNTLLAFRIIEASFDIDVFRSKKYNTGYRCCNSSIDVCYIYLIAKLYFQMSAFQER